MPKKSLAVAFTISLILSAGLWVAKVDANPTWGKPASPIPPITDPPQIIINSPTNEPYSNLVPLNITIIQPDSWETRESGNVSGLIVVGGQNTLRQIICIVDGQSILLWNGSRFSHYETIWNGSRINNFGTTFLLPKVSQFSAVMDVGNGQHTLQVDVLVDSRYVTEGIIPFAGRDYFFFAYQSTAFSVINSSANSAPKLYNITDPYSFSAESSESFHPSSTSTALPTSTDPESSGLLSFNVLEILAIVTALIIALSILLIYGWRRGVSKQTSQT